MIRCDNCKKVTEDIYSEVGWIEIDDVHSITVHGGREETGMSDAFRYIDTRDKSKHLCSLQCLIDFLYLKEGHFNSPRTPTLREKLDSIKEEKRKVMLNNIISQAVQITSLITHQE